MKKAKWLVILSDGSTWDTVQGCRLVLLNEAGEEEIETSLDAECLDPEHIDMDLQLSVIAQNIQEDM